MKTTFCNLPIGALLCAFLHQASGTQKYNKPLPSQAQFIDQTSFNVLSDVPPISEVNGTTVFVPPNVKPKAWTDKPFHVYHEDFLDIIGDDPSLTVIASQGINPLFHEAVVWYPPTNEMFFVQNAGPPEAGTGLNKSAVIGKIDLAQAMAVRTKKNATGEVDVTIINGTSAGPHTVINPNGATNYRGQIVYMGEGMGAHVAPAMYLMNPRPPYNTTVLLNNFFGRQFNSLNDVAIHPKNGEIYFTDVTYGYLQDFRPPPGLPNQVYRFNPATGAVSVVASDFVRCNGIAFSPDGTVAYVTDTGVSMARSYDFTLPASIYRYKVRADGSFVNRQFFAYVTPGAPDGVHTDAKGNVYAGCGDGVQVWNPKGTLIGKIYLGTTSANFQIAGNGRMVICAETQLYFAKIAAKAAPIPHV